MLTDIDYALTTIDKITNFGIYWVSTDIIMKF